MHCKDTRTQARNPHKDKRPSIASCRCDPLGLCEISSTCHNSLDIRITEALPVGSILALIDRLKTTTNFLLNVEKVTLASYSSFFRFQFRYTYVTCLEEPINFKTL